MEDNFNQPQEEKTTENDFDKRFFKAHGRKPQKGEVLARYRAVAELIPGGLKNDMVRLLSKGKADSASKLFNKFGGAIYPDAWKVCKEISQDLLSMSEEEVLNKPYEFVFEALYYTNPEDFPQNDPHWTLIGLNNIFQDIGGNTLKVSSKLTK